MWFIGNKKPEKKSPREDFTLKVYIFLLSVFEEVLVIIFCCFFDLNHNIY